MSVKVEQQIAALTSLVAKLIEKVDNMDTKFENRFEQLENRFENLENRLDTEQKLNQARFDELIKETRTQNFVMNHHRDKIAKNEEDIVVIKQMLQSQR